jgi:hypothetical protein
MRLREWIIVAVVLLVLWRKRIPMALVVLFFPNVLLRRTMERWAKEQEQQERKKEAGRR